MKLLVLKIKGSDVKDPNLSVSKRKNDRPAWLLLLPLQMGVPDVALLHLGAKIVSPAPGGKDRTIPRVAKAVNKPNKR